MNSDILVGQDVDFKGVRLPDNVMRELVRLGGLLETYTIGQLQKAVNACAMDGKLVDDEHGVNFDDKLELTKEEQEKCNRAGTVHGEMDEECEEDDQHHHCRNEHKKRRFSSFCEWIEKQRASEIHECKEYPTAA